MPSTTAPAAPPAKQRTEKEIQSDIREIMKQISSSITYLPMLDEPCPCPSPPLPLPLASPLAPSHAR